MYYYYNNYIFIFSRGVLYFLYVSANFQKHIQRFFLLSLLLSWRSLRLWTSPPFPANMFALFSGNVSFRFTGMKNQNRTRAGSPDNALEGTTAVVRASFSLPTYRPPRRYFTPTTTSTTRTTSGAFHPSVVFKKKIFFIDYRRSTHTI